MLTMHGGVGAEAGAWAGVGAGAGAEAGAGAGAGKRNTEHLSVQCCFAEAHSVQPKGVLPRCVLYTEHPFQSSAALPQLTVYN